MTLSFVGKTWFIPLFYWSWCEQHPRVVLHLVNTKYAHARVLSTKLVITIGARIAKVHFPVERCAMHVPRSQSVCVGSTRRKRTFELPRGSFRRVSASGRGEHQDQLSSILRALIVCPEAAPSRRLYSALRGGVYSAACLPALGGHASRPCVYVL